MDDNSTARDLKWAQSALKKDMNTSLRSLRSLCDLCVKSSPRIKRFIIGHTYEPFTTRASR